MTEADVILKSSRLATTGSAKRIIDHLLRGADNDRVTLLRGGARDIRDAWADARVHDKANALRLWSLSPAVATSREEALAALDDIAKEFGLDPRRAIIVEHEKDRADPTAFHVHWHMCAGEVDPITGKVLSSSHDHARHEFLARLVEHHLHHPFVLGAHTTAVLARMRRDGLTAAADALSHANGLQADTGPPKGAFSSIEHQVAKRRGVDLSEVQLMVTAAWKGSRSMTDLKAALSQVGLSMEPGRVEGEWIVPLPGVKPHSLRRLLRMKKAAFGEQMEGLIDADAIAARSPRDRDDHPCGNRTHASGHRRVAEVRGDARAAGRRPDGKLHVGDDAPARSAGSGDRRDAPTPRSNASSDRRSAPVGGAPRGDGVLIGTATTCVTAVFALVRRAHVVSTPAPARIDAVIRRYEAAYQALRAKPRKALSRADIDRLKAVRLSTSADAMAVSAEIDTTTKRINSLSIDRRRRARLPWSRWLHDREADVVIAGLEAHRETLRSQFATLQTAAFKAGLKERDAGSALVVAHAEADQKRGEALKLADKRAAILSRARRLLLRVPALAYLGAKRLLAMATRIEKAREQGYDPGPGHGSGLTIK